MEQLFFELALILVVTKTLGLISRRVHLPQVVGALLAGVILGPAVFGLVKQGEMISGLAEIGVILLLFEAGLETDLRQLKKSLRMSLIIALLDVAVAFGAAFAVSRLFGIGTFESLFIGLVLTSSSISITVEALQEMNKLKTGTGTTILSVAVIDDILGVIILSFILGMGGSETGASLLDIGFILLKIVGFLVFALAFSFGMLKLMEFISKKRVKIRRLPIYSLAFCFFMAYLAELFGLADITGAYIAGLALSTSRVEHYVEEKSVTLSYMFFSPVFFVSVGLNASFAGLDAGVLIFAGVLLITAIASKVAGNGLGALLCKFKLREAMQIGTGMVSRGEVSIIIATSGLLAGLLSSQVFSSLIIIVIITSLVTPLFLKLAFAEKSASAIDMLPGEYTNPQLPGESGEPQKSEQQSAGEK